jgi:hypothetical protein
MKKKLLLTVAALVVSLSAYAQGTVAFQGSGVRDASVAGMPLVTNPAGTAEDVVAGLYWAPVGSTDFVLLGAVATVGFPSPGIYNGGTRSTGPATAGGAEAQFQVRAWELAFGSTYEAAIAAPAINGRKTKAGVSNTIQVVTGNPGGMPPTNQQPLTGLNAFNIEVVPEPSVIALGVIGAGALLLLRRRK